MYAENTHGYYAHRNNLQSPRCFNLRAKADYGNMLYAPECIRQRQQNVGGWKIAKQARARMHFVTLSRSRNKHIEGDGKSVVATRLTRLPPRSYWTCAYPSLTLNFSLSPSSILVNVSGNGSAQTLWLHTNARRLLTRHYLTGGGGEAGWYLFSVHNFKSIRVLRRRSAMLFRLVYVCGINTGFQPFLYFLYILDIIFFHFMNEFVKIL